METAPKPRQKSYHKGSSLYFTAGLIFSMVLITTAFEWKTPFKLSGNQAIDLPTGPDEIIDMKVLVLPTPPVLQSENLNIIETDQVPPKDPVQIELPILPDIDIKVDPTVTTPDLTALVPKDKPAEVEVVDYVDFAEEEAQPLGGLKAFYEFLGKHMEYPRQAQRLGIEGTVLVRFIVDQKGNVTFAEVLEGRGLGYGLDEEAIRVIKLTKWTPAKMGGRAVKQRKIQPVTFKLQR